MQINKTLAILFIFVAALFTPLFSQDSVEPASAPAEIEKVVKLSSPRETVRLFMSIMNDVAQGNVQFIDRALATMYLEDLPAENREAKSIEMANKLFRILNSFTFKIDAIPEELSGRTYTLPIGKELGISIVIYRYDNENWKFNYTRTLANLDDYIVKLEESQRKISEDTTIDPVFKSPRDTMNFFFTQMNNQTQAGYEEAIKALLSSWVVFENTLYLTLNSSHAVFVFGGING